MTIPSPIPLDDFERAIQADTEVLGMFYFGSLGRRTATRFSDLDIFVRFPDDVARPAHDKLFQLLGLFGQIHWLENEGTGFVGPAWTQVDIEYAHGEDLKPDPRYAGATVIKDTDGALEAMVAACEPERITETVESARDVIHGAISDQLFNARHNARGLVWPAMEASATGVCSHTNYLAGCVAGAPTATAMWRNCSHRKSRSGSPPHGHVNRHARRTVVRHMRSGSGPSMYGRRLSEQSASPSA
jgi:hypothetical protein